MTINQLTNILHIAMVSITVQPTTSHPPPAAITFSANLTSGSPTTINPSSSFEDLPTAKQFLTHLFAAYAIHPRTKNLTKVSITRSEWKLEALHEFEGRFEFMQNVEAPFKGDVRLDSAFHVEDLYYYWYTLEQFPAEGGESVKGRVKGGVLEDDSERRRSPI
ncbi:hypothetical protein HK104_002410 [Borealophlyctis nickersoniae]|nr:hypothetical protein HK104_002410 [Borealophlyctis nickersoniae]